MLTLNSDREWSHHVHGITVYYYYQHQCNTTDMSFDVKSLVLKFCYACFQPTSHGKWMVSKWSWWVTNYTALWSTKLQKLNRCVTVLFQTILHIRSSLELFSGYSRAPSHKKRTQIFNVSDSQNIGLPQVQAFHTN